MDLTQFSHDSKIWIYQSNRYLSTDQESIITHKLTQFVAEWNSHGAMLKAGFDVVDHRFIIIAVDEASAKASGCSIDKSVTVIKEIEAAFGLGLLERGNVSYQSKSGEIMTIAFNQIKQTMANGDITADTLVYDNNVESLGLLKTEWLKKAETTWLQKYFAKDLSI